MEDLTLKVCVACEGGVPPLSRAQIEEMHVQVPAWTVSSDNTHITREYLFKDFAEALAFANKVGAIAEQEGHHPDLTVSWGKVSISLTTHAIGGLSENDFILAAKVEALDT